MRRLASALLGVAALSVAACSSDRGTRALEGAGIGGAVGAIGTAVAGGSVVTGAAVGAAAGAVVGAVTTERDIDLNN